MYAKWFVHISTKLNKNESKNAKFLHLKKNQAVEPLIRVALIHFKPCAPHGINCVHIMPAHQEGNKNDYLGEYSTKTTAQTNF